MEKQLVIELGDVLQIKNDDLTLSDIIKAAALLDAVIKEAEKENPDVNYKEIREVIEKIAEDITSLSLKNNDKDIDESKKD
jgi:succinylglutamate desuccinylase